MDEGKWCKREGFREGVRASEKDNDGVKKGMMSREIGMRNGR